MSEVYLAQESLFYFGEILTRLNPTGRQIWNEDMMPNPNKVILPKIHMKKIFGLQPSQTNKRTIVTTLLMQLSILWSILMLSYFMAYAIVKESQ